MKHGHKITKDILNDMELKFVQCFEGVPFKAAKDAGYKNPKVSGYKLMRRPRIQKALATKQESLAKQSGKQLGRKIAISRNDIIMGLADIAQKGEGESARVSAYSKLADIFGLMPKPSGKDVDMFAGWSDEELQHYRITGELPSRFGLSVEDDGKPDPNPTLPPNS